jgi:hypothetical protein
MTDDQGDERMTENHENPADATPFHAAPDGTEPAAQLPDGAGPDATGPDTTEPDPSAALPAGTSASVMDLLAEHVPLALLADLAAPDGPVSQAILETEGMPDDAWWEGDDRPATPEGEDPGADDERPVDPDAAAG